MSRVPNPVFRRTRRVQGARARIRRRGRGVGILVGASRAGEDRARSLSRGTLARGVSRRWRRRDAWSASIERVEVLARGGALVSRSRGRRRPRGASGTRVREPVRTIARDAFSRHAGDGDRVRVRTRARVDRLGVLLRETTRTARRVRDGVVDDVLGRGRGGGDLRVRRVRVHRRVRARGHADARAWITQSEFHRVSRLGILDVFDVRVRAPRVLRILPRRVGSSVKGESASSSSSSRGARKRSFERRVMVCVASLQL